MSKPAGRTSSRRAVAADEVLLIDDPRAPELFATVATGFFYLDGNVAVTFESARVDHSVTPGRISRVVVGRLVLPVAGAQNLVIALNDFLESQGLSPSKAASGNSSVN